MKKKCSLAYRLLAVVIVSLNLFYAINAPCNAGMYEEIDEYWTTMKMWERNGNAFSHSQFGEDAWRPKLLGTKIKKGICIGAVQLLPTPGQENKECVFCGSIAVKAEYTASEETDLVKEREARSKMPWLCPSSEAEEYMPGFMWNQLSRKAQTFLGSHALNGREDLPNWHTLAAITIHRAWRYDGRDGDYWDSEEYLNNPW